MRRLCVVCSAPATGTASRCERHLIVRSNGRPWRALRLEILKRDNWRCMIGGDGCTIVASTVDHIVPLAHGGTDDPANLRAACARCNYRRGAREAA